MVRVALFFVMLLAALDPARAEKRAALFIGDSAYRHAQSPINPKNEATDVAAALRFTQKRAAAHEFMTYGRERTLSCLP
jgi:hypothetical protein